MPESRRTDIVRRSKLLLNWEQLDTLPPYHLVGSADAFILDVTTIPTSREEQNFERVREWLEPLIGKGVDLFAKVSVDACARVLDRMSGMPLDGVAVSVTGPEEICEVDAVLGKHEVRTAGNGRRLEIDLFIDSPLTAFRLRDIVEASSRVSSLTLDEPGLLKALNVSISQEIDQFFFPRGMALLVARLTNTTAYGLAFVPPGNEGNAANPEERAAVARKLGLMGALCRSVEEATRLNRGFTPDEEEVRWARKALWVLEEAIRQGRGSASIDGTEMVDIAMFKHVRHLLQREAAICLRDAQKTVALER